mmetsp:Transcript_18283/g.44002  ORF Transcript_18283/g.44002 Transcript_18283/m.44002 type:complete len:95 (-) Transcript_18283:2059-2343(-)
MWPCERASTTSGWKPLSLSCIGLARHDKIGDGSSTTRTTTHAKGKGQAPRRRDVLKAKGGCNKTAAAAAALHSRAAARLLGATIKSAERVMERP